MAKVFLAIPLLEATYFGSPETAGSGLLPAFSYRHTATPGSAGIQAILLGSTKLSYWQLALALSAQLRAEASGTCPFFCLALWWLLEGQSRAEWQSLISAPKAWYILQFDLTAPVGSHCTNHASDFLLLDAPIRCFIYILHCFKLDQCKNV